MILESLIGFGLSLIAGVLFVLLPEAPGCTAGVTCVGSPLGPEPADFSQLTGLLSALDTGLPISDAVLPGVGVYLGLLGVVFAISLLRMVIRFAPSWLTGGG